jgi:broad-specificity NMP kinase
MQIIELTGIPGSGKSTFLKSFCCELKQQGVSFVIGNQINVGTVQSVGTLIVFLFLRPRLLLFIGRVVLLRFRYFLIKDTFLTLTWYARTIKQFKVAKKLDIDYVVFDEGYVHRLYTLGVFHPDHSVKNVFNQYVDSLLQPDVLVILTQHQNVSFERLLARSMPSRWCRYDVEAQEMLLGLCVEISDFYIANTDSLASNKVLVDPQTIDII